MSVTAAPTTRPIDLAQLAIELGTPEAPAGLSMLETDTERVVDWLDEAATLEALEAAIAAHVPTPPPTPPTTEELLEAALAEQRAATEALLADQQYQIDQLTDLLLEL